MADQKVQWFGEKPFARLCEPGNRCDPPVNKACAWCDEPIEPGENGLLVINITLAGEPAPIPWHHECFLRSLSGSVRHQLRKCSCYAGPDNDGRCNEDTDGLSLRDEARLAAKMWRER